MLALVLGDRRRSNRGRRLHFRRLGYPPLSAIQSWSSSVDRYPHGAPPVCSGPPNLGRAFQVLGLFRNQRIQRRDRTAFGRYCSSVSAPHKQWRASCAFVERATHRRSLSGQIVAPVRLWRCGYSAHPWRGRSVNEFVRILEAPEGQQVPKLDKPFKLTICVTQTCNMDCKLCYADCGSSKRPELTTEQWKAFIDQLV